MKDSLPSQIVFIGAGYTAQRLVREVLSQENCATRFVLTSRQPEQHLGEFLDHDRVQCVALDLLDDAQLDERLATIFSDLEPDAHIIYSAPTLYRSYEPAADGSLARHVRPLDAVVRQASAQGVQGIVYLSSTSVYGDHQGEWVDEESTCEPESALGRMRLDLERYLEGCSWGGGEGEMYSCHVARIVGIYGPGRTLADYIARGKYKLVDEGKKVTNRVHVDDLGRAILAMVAHNEPGFHRYNVSDGHPLTVRWLVRYLVEHHGVEMPESVSLDTYAEERGENVAARWRSTYRCSSAALQKDLGWRPHYRNALHGLEKILKG